VVIAGFRDRICQPDPMDPNPLTFCGYQIGAIPEDDASFYLLVSCTASNLTRTCWPIQFLSTCP